MNTVRIWDLPTRLFHWSLAICFAGAWLTSDSERQQLLHLLFGSALAVGLAVGVGWGWRAAVVTTVVLAVAVAWATSRLPDSGRRRTAPQHER